MHFGLTQPKCFPFVLFQDYTTFQNLKNQSQRNELRSNGQMQLWFMAVNLSLPFWSHVPRKGLLVLKVSDRALGFHHEGKKWLHSIMELWVLLGSVAERGCWLFHHVAITSFFPFSCSGTRYSSIVKLATFYLTWRHVHLHYFGGWNSWSCSVLQGLDQTSVLLWHLVFSQFSLSIRIAINKQLS